MAAKRHLVMNSGGLRSLVATALACREQGRVRVRLLHVVDGRQTRATRLEHARRQAEHFELGEVAEVVGSHLYGTDGGREADGRPRGSLVRPQLMLMALERGACDEAEAVIWPGSHNGEVETTGFVTEQMVLINQLAGLETDTVPRLDAPLLELTDRQIIELGVRLEVPWGLAWSCLLKQDEPCGMCAACTRRRAAFARAGVVDTAAAAA